MRLPFVLRVWPGLLSGLLILAAGCSNPSSQSPTFLSVTATPATVSVGDAVILHAIVHFSSGTTQDVTSNTQWTLSNPALATMGNGVLISRATGSLTVQGNYVEAASAGQSASTAGSPPQNLSSSAQITMTAASTNTNTPTITWNTPAAIQYGTALGNAQLNATANTPGNFAYAPAAGTVLHAGSQTLTAIFIPANNTNSSAAMVTVPLSVTQAIPVITWAPPSAIPQGTALSATQLGATASVPGSFSYTPAAGTVLQAGTQPLTATFTPSDTTDYTPATAHNTLTVTGSSGATLTAIQINASSSSVAVGSTLQLTATGTYSDNSTQNLTNTTSWQSSNTSLATVSTGGIATGIGGGTAQITASSNGVSSAPFPLNVTTALTGTVVNVNASMSQSTLQSTISGAPSGATVLFAAGTYNLSSSLQIPCSSNLTLTGPAATPATAILAATFTGSDILFLTGCSGITIEYLHFENTGGIYVWVPASGSSGITITHNQFSGLPGKDEETGAATFFDSGEPATGGTLSETSITWNNFGSATDCEGVMAEQTDQDGYCAGALFNASLNNITVSNNTFLHLEEGFHVLCVNGTDCDGPPAGNTWSNFTAENNDFSGIHRIGMEMQPQPSSNILIEYNDMHDLTNPYTLSMGISSACCNTGATAPGTIDSNNVLIANTPAPNTPPQYIAYAMEFWGNSALAQNNLIQGYWANGIAFGYAPNAIITNNNICGPNMSGGGGAYIKNEEGQATPTITPNTTSAACSAITSTAPTISPASGAISSATTITLSDAGTNHSVYYTTDGSTPTTASTLYTGPFTVAPGTTVKAIGMWGQGANAKSYPAGYGYVPSGVVSATYVASAIAKPVSGTRITRDASGAVGLAAAAPTATNSPAGSGAVPAELDSVTIVPSEPALTIGGTTQLKAIATFSDGSTRDVTADFGWKSSDARTVGATSSGMLAGLASGQAIISGSYQGRQASVTALSAMGEVQWSGPVVITEAGTYSGNWQSVDPRTPAVTVATAAPVIIENSHIRSVAGLIEASVAGTDLTVRNSIGVAVNPAAKGLPNGIFLDASSPARLDVENNYIENARSGVLVHGYSGARDGNQTIVIRANRARNFNGLLSDGNGGYLPGEGPTRSLSYFVELDSVQSVPGIDIGWNEVINYPGHSLVGDIIDIYRSGGTPNGPLEIHDTYIQGAYPYQAAQDAYEGGGIKTDGNSDDTAQSASAFNSIHNNQVVGTVSYGIAFGAGHDNIASNNRVISSGLLADGTKIAAQHVGMVSEDIRGANQAHSSTYNNTMRDNLIGWMCWKAACSEDGYRKDQYFPASPGDYTNNSILPATPITLDTEENEYQIWLNKMVSAGITIGPTF
jgi:Chitobiase/beta-hexosaminidase C-terminal domain/Bacterial Ig-like domain (group 2)